VIKRGRLASVLTLVALFLAGTAFAQTDPRSSGRKPRHGSSTVFGVDGRQSWDPSLFQ
jgi:predicted nucleic acid-binding Zn ribbon protein